MVMSETLQLTIRYEHGEEGWIVASIPQVPGALSQGRTREQARANVLDALRLLLSPKPGERGESESLELTIGP
jgi:predicted RNase H-like HicB family nuclease